MKLRDDIRAVTMSETVKDRLIKRFEEEIQSLDRELKLELPREIKRARELGDLSENAEYAAAKERQRLLATVAAILAIAIRNAQLFQEVRENSLRDALTGCFHRVHALDVIDTGKPKMLEFGVADETAWKVGLSCGGTIRVFVEKVE